MVSLVDFKMSFKDSLCVFQTIPGDFDIFRFLCAHVAGVMKETLQKREKYVKIHKNTCFLH